MSGDDKSRVLARRVPTLSRIKSSIGVAVAILAETEKRRRGNKPGRVRGSIGSEQGRCRCGGREEKKRSLICGGSISAELHRHDINPAQHNPQLRPRCCFDLS